MGQVKQEQMPIITQMLKMQAMDELEKEKGAKARDVDIILAVTIHNLEKDPELQAIMQRAAKSLNDQV